MAKSDTQIIDDVLVAEGPQQTNDPLDAGGRTQFGISEKSNPAAWADGKVTEEEAREIYARKYIKGPGFDKILDTSLRAQLVDYGVNSGPAVAIMKLQAIVGTTVDGVLGPKTLAAIHMMHPEAVSTELVKARVRMICRIVKRDPSQIKWLGGWIDRALEFL